MSQEPPTVSQPETKAAAVDQYLVVLKQLDKQVDGLMDEIAKLESWPTSQKNANWKIKRDAVKEELEQVRKKRIQRLESYLRIQSELARWE